MAYEKKNGDFVLFLNDKKGVQTRPDWRGEVFIDGKTYEISAWNKKSANGKPFLSGVAKEKQDLN